MTEPFYNHFDDIKLLVDRAGNLLKTKPQFTRVLVYNLTHDMDELIADINDKMLELSRSYTILDERRMSTEGDRWFADPQSYQWKFNYTLQEDDDWRAILSELETIKGSRDTLSSVKWDLSAKRKTVLLIFEKEV